MNKTFFLSNILPQDLDNNGRYWNLMEIYSRNLVKKFKDVYVVSGPLFLPLLFEDGKLYMKYQVGMNEQSWLLSVSTRLCDCSSKLLYTVAVLFCR